MSNSGTIPNTLHVPIGQGNEPEPHLEQHLQQVYGSGTYISDFYKSENGNVSLSIGNSFPKDVSDCRPHRDRVIKYIAVDDIADLSAKYNGNKYIVDLEPRPSVNKGFLEGKQQLRDDLDQALAKATYKKIAGTPAVENQLNPIKQILRWTRLHDEPLFEEVKDAQNKDDNKTKKYVDILEELGFIKYEEGRLYPQDPLEKYEIGEVEAEEFNKAILGEVIEQGFKRLSEDLGLRILLHLPKFANGYYFDAIERNDPGLHLNMEKIQENMIDWYGYSAKVHRFELQDKLNLLDSLDILDKENGYFTAHTKTFNEMNDFTPI